MLKRVSFALLAAVLLASPASAQLLPDVGGTVGQVLNPPLGEVTDTARELTNNAVNELRNARQTALNELRRRHPDLIDRDREGALVVRNEVVAIAPSAEALAAARARGFVERETIEASELGLRVIVLRAPDGMSTRRAVETLRRLDPGGAYEFNHIYFGAGMPSGHGAKQAISRAGAASGARIGLIDSGVDAGHAAFAGARIEQRGFGGGAVAGAHGTAIASILVGESGAARGASLFVADVYGGRPSGGGVSSIVAALNWLTQSRIAVINISLVGPRNRALEAAVNAAIARGVVVVAAVGNDGPAAPPLYPASYPGVVGVTGVDGRNRVLPEAGRGEQVDFAAPGMDFDAASLTGGYARVRGTSYASPIVAAYVARNMASPSVASAREAQAQLARSATDLGPRGRDRTFGAGLIGQEMRSATLARR